MMKNNKKKSNKEVNKMSTFNVIENIDGFHSFITDYEKEILSNIYGESDGWNQKMDVINKILDRNDIVVLDTVWEDVEVENIINNI